MSRYKLLAVNKSILWLFMKSSGSDRVQDGSNCFEKKSLMGKGGERLYRYDTVQE